MALPETKIADIPNLQKRISGLKTQESSYQGKLNTSPTALGGSGAPTSYDVSNQVSLERVRGEIQSLNDNIARARWYPPKEQNAAAEEGSGGILGSTLNFLAKPLYGVVGATKHAIGQGKGSLYQDIAENMQRNRNTFSDVLKTTGVPSGVAAPLGFALDIAFDPINWATMGSAALLPRLGMGVYKGLAAGNLAKGFSSAAKSGVLEKAAMIGRFTPRFRGSETFKTLGKKAIAATKDWETFSGTTAADLVLQRGAGAGRYRGLLGTGINKIADATPGGRALLDTLWYSPKDWIRNTRIKDIFQKHLGADVDMEKAIEAYKKGPEAFASFMREATTAAKERMAAIVPEIRKEASIGNLVDSGADLVSLQQVDLFANKVASANLTDKLVDPKAVRGLDDAYGAAISTENVLTGDHLEKALQMTNEEVGGALVTIQDMEKLVKMGALDETGVKWFDNFINWNRSWEKQIGTNSKKITLRGKTVMEAYDFAMALFRVSKVAASAAAYPFAIMGNMAMTHLANGDLGPGFLSTLKLTSGFYLDRPGAAKKINDLLKSRPDLLPFFDEYMTATRATFGTNNFKKAQANMEKLADEFLSVNKGKIPGGMTRDDLMRPLRETMAEFEAVGLSKKQTEGFAAFRKALDKTTPSEAGTTGVREALSKGGDYDLAAGMMGVELYNSRRVAEFSQKVEDALKANPGNWGLKFANGIINKAPSLYDKVDQSFKLATFLRATTHGYTAAQLRQMRHLVEISPEELSLWENVVEGQTLYRLSPKTALELANIMYLNYNAMPSAIRVMRNLPLFGNPFISFMYGMTLKTGQALAYNPSAFNKVTFAMNDFGGTKTPLEKKALDDPNGYYSYLKQPGMFRLPSIPLFGENPTYLNLANALPYYSLSMFGPSQSGPSGTTREALSKLVQRSPFMKDPVGSIIYDYMILPTILGETIQPKGQFGQLLYPMDAGTGTKALYGARTLAEAFVPNVMAYAGLVTPEAAAPYLPLYRWRDLTNAMVGKNQFGITRKEPELNQMVRTLFKISGFPVQSPINTSFIK